MKFIDYKIKEISKVMAGGDKPKVCSDVYSDETPIPIYSNGMENEGLYGYTDVPKVEGDTVTISARGVNVGKVCYRETPFLPIVRLLSLIPDRKLIYVKYLYYYLKTVNISGTGSAQPQVTVPMISDLQIHIHKDIDEQKKIASFLSTLDDKIKINNQINRNLSEQAKALFKEKFLVIDCMPLYWKEMTLEDVSILNAGGDKPKVVSEIRSEECTVPIYSNGISNEGIYGFTTDAKIINESVTVSARGTIGFVCLRQEPYVPIVRLISVVPKENIMTAKYLYLWLESLHIMGTGTTQQQLTVPDFKKTRIIVPPIQKIREFTDLVNPIYENILRNKKENEKLSELRDNLLPKLMSGELDVSDLDI